MTGDALLASIIGGFGTLAGSLYGHLFDETVREFLSKAGQGGGLLPYLRALLGQEALDVDAARRDDLGGLIDLLLDGHASLRRIGIPVSLRPRRTPGRSGTCRWDVAEALPAKVWGESDQ